MVAPTFKKATDRYTDPSGTRYGAPDIKYVMEVLDATHPTDRIQISAIEHSDKFTTHAIYARPVPGSSTSYQAVRGDTGSVISGATGTDFGAVLTTAINALPIPSSSDAIGIIKLSGTTLDCTASPIVINNKSNLIIDGLGSAIIRKTTDYTANNRAIIAIENGSSDIIIRNLTLDASPVAATTTARPIVCAPTSGASGATAVSNILIDNVRIKNAYNPIFFNAPSGSGRIIDNVVIRNLWIDNVAGTAQAGPGVFIGLGCKNITLHHCYMIEPGDNAIQVTASNEFVKIWGNYILKNTATTGNGIYVSNIGSVTADQGSTKHVVIRDNRILGPITADGIRIEGAAEDIVVANNFVNGGTRDGISISNKTVSAVDYWAKETLVLGNIIQNMGRHGIFVQSVNTIEFQAFKISNNYINEIQSNGIEVNSGVSNAIIANNMVYRYGLNLATDRAGIHLRLANNNIVIGNKIWGPTTGMGTNYRSIWEENTSNNNIITNNGVNNPIGFVGVNTIIALNDGFKTEAAGTASITGTNTTVPVTHGLGYTPALKDIYITPTTTWGSATSFWVSNPTATEFTINRSPAPGSSQTMTFAWQTMRTY